MAVRYIQQHNRMMRWFLKLEELYERDEISQKLKERKQIFYEKNGEKLTSSFIDLEEPLFYMQASKDIVYAFFQNCHHLKDWLQHDPVLSNTHPDIKGKKGKLEDFRNKRKCLQICGNLCNCSKHMELTIKHPEEFPTKIGPGHGYTIERDGDKLLAKHYGYKVEWNGCEKDALELVKECIEAWDEFLKQNSILVPTDPAF